MIIKVVPITIEVTGTEFLSSAIPLEMGLRLLGWEFTTPDYTNVVTTTLTVLSVGARTLVTGSAVNKDTASTKICDTNEQAPLFSGFKLGATLSGAAGGASAYTLTVILYME